MKLKISPDQQLVERSVSGAYIYFGAWVLIGYLAGYYNAYPKNYFIASVLLGLFGASRIWTYYKSKKLIASNPKLWQSLVAINSIGPALVFGVLFAISMQQVDQKNFFNYLLMANLALLSGAMVTFAPNRNLSNLFLLCITLPALLVALVMPEQRGIEATMLALYMVYNFFMVQALNKEHLERSEQRKALEEMARTDPLTGLFNRRYFDEAFDRCWAYQSRIKTSITMVMLDIDNFKQVNDCFGHPVGDEIIKKVAQVVADNFQRETDVLARIGGEEFAILVQNTSFEDTFEMAQTVCHQLNNYSSETANGQVTVTVSIGMAHALPSPGIDQKNFYKLADNCLYQAKANGKNQLIAKKFNSPPVTSA